MQFSSLLLLLDSIVTLNSRGLEFRAEDNTHREEDMAMLGSLGAAQKKTNALAGDRDLTEFVCPVCLEIFDSPVITQCGHT